MKGGKGSMGLERIRLVSANAKTGRVKISVMKYVVTLQHCAGLWFLQQKLLQFSAEQCSGVCGGVMSTETWGSLQHPQGLLRSLLAKSAGIVYRAGHWELHFWCMANASYPALLPCSCSQNAQLCWSLGEMKLKWVFWAISWKDGKAGHSWNSVEIRSALLILNSASL